MTIFANGDDKSGVYYNGAVMDKVYANGVMVYERATHTLVAVDVSGFGGSGAVGYLITGSLTPDTFVRNNGGTATITQLYTGVGGSISGGTFGPELNISFSGGTANSQTGTWSNLDITGTFDNGARTQSYTPADTKSYFGGSWELYNTGGKGDFVVGNTYSLNWT